MWDSAKDKARIDQDLTPIPNLTYHTYYSYAPILELDKTFTCEK